MATVFQTRPSGRFIEIKSQLRRKKLYRTNQGSNFFGDSFSNRDNLGVLIQFRGETKSQHVKRWYFFKNRTITSKGKELDWPNQTSWVFQHWYQQVASLLHSTECRRSDSSLQGNSTSCHKSDTWSHLDESVVSSA